MKIILVNKFHYLKGGSETYYFGLAEGLKAGGHEVHFFAMEGIKISRAKMPTYLFRQRITTDRLRSRKKSPLLPHLSIPMRLKRNSRHCVSGYSRTLSI